MKIFQSWVLDVFTTLLQAEDAVCLADYCDIMRCEVLQKQNEKDGSGMANNDPLQLHLGKNGPITDLEVWREPTQRNALSIISNAAKSTSTTLQDRAKTHQNLCDK